MAGIENDPGQAYIGGDTISEAFWRILCLDIYVSDAPGDGATLIRRAAAKDQALHLAYWYTRLTGLEHGYMGFAPIGTKPADRICVLAGGRAPLIVRAVPKNGGEASKRFVCRLLGDAYVHGLMDGEAMKLVDDGVLKVDDFELI
ncbi:hypothetical protein KJ359_008943 [Pestalotiopsis sp. 9143b]|nr:hypothetical protein KJ359_008943 [Pestalotiopsis sp. 9143b]